VSLVDPFAPEHRADPYPTYAALRACAPLVYHERLGFWIATRAESVRAIFSDPSAFSSAKGIGERRNEVIGRPTMLTRDPPDHTRLKALVSHAFTPRRIAELEPRVRQIVDGLLDAGLSRGRFDLVEDLARPLPTAVLADLLSVEPARLPDFARWSDDIFKSVTLLGGHDRQRAKQSYQEFDAYFGAKVEERRRAHQGDLLGALVTAQEEQGALALSMAEILNFCMLLFIAGTETTTNLITNTVLALLAHAEARDKLRADLSLVGNAVEETLRYDAPVQGIFRTTRREVSQFGVTLPADQKVLVLIGSANRDPEAFPEPDRFDQKRAPNAHVAFGHGIHYCLGAALARLEAKVALSALLARAPDLRPDPEGSPRRVEMPLSRGMERYPVLLSPV
jgi:cytochrome P450